MRPHVIRRYVTQMTRINLCLYLIKIRDLQNVNSVFWVDTIIKSCGNTTIQLMDIYEYTYYICTHCKMPSLKDLRLTRELSNIVTNSNNYDVSYLQMLAWHYSWVIIAFENSFYRVTWVYNMLFFNTTISYEQSVRLQCVRSKVVEIKKISIPINQMAWTCRIRLFFYI